MQLRAIAVLAAFVAGLALGHADEARADNPSMTGSSPATSGIPPHKFRPPQFFEEQRRPKIDERIHLTGDWGGARTWLSENGIIVDVQATQFYQGVVDGALDYGGKYGLKVDYFLTLLG